VAFPGGGFMATFGTPAAGLRCAIAIQQALQKYGPDNADRRIRVGSGCTHGEAVQRDGTLYGRPSTPPPASCPRRSQARPSPPRPCGTRQRQPERSCSDARGLRVLTGHSTKSLPRISP
jgi:hypothetical protein